MGAPTGPDRSDKWSGPPARIAATSLGHPHRLPRVGSGLIGQREEVTVHVAPLTAAALTAHAVHLALILLGTAGVVGLLAPGWRSEHAARVERRQSKTDSR